MDRKLLFANSVEDLEVILQTSPRTQALQELARVYQFHSELEDWRSPIIEQYLVNSSQEEWSEVKFQSLYLDLTSPDPADRVVLLEPATSDRGSPEMVLKSARLSENLGMVFCGTPEMMNQFIQKIPEYEARGVDLDDDEFLYWLKDAAEADGVKINFMRTAEGEGNC